MRKLCIPALALACLLPAWASNPGEPLDCSDWVFLEPGLSCAVAIPMPCDSSTPFEPWCGGSGTGGMADNEGGVLRLQQILLETVTCPGSSSPELLRRTRLVRFRNGAMEVVAYVDDRCGDPGTRDLFSAVPGFVFDDKLGRIYVSSNSHCQPDAAACSYSETGKWLAEFNGFTTLFDVLQTYEPAANGISFRVPAIPEGLGGADWFDTYAGRLANPIDFSKARPLSCGYPVSPPVAGDYLTVADALPDPPPGEGFYFVTAVTYQGETRYGRRSSGGVLSGRDPALLPACTD